MTNWFTVMGDGCVRFVLPLIYRMDCRYYMG